MAAPLLLDLSHTSHTSARTGIQRVARSLHAALGARGTAITFDPYERVWRELQAWEQRALTRESVAKKRSAQWPLTARLRGRARQLVRQRAHAAAGARLADNSGLIVPEVFSPAVARALPTLFAACGGPRVALFHDAIALKFPELTPPKTVARFPPYLVELLSFDGIAAVSEDSRSALLDYWGWLGARNIPPVQTICLGVVVGQRRGAQPPDGNGVGSNPGAAGAAPVVLCVGSIEGRKNHIALLEACEQLWHRGARFSLQLIGLAHPETGRAAMARLRALQAAGRPVRYDGVVSDAAIEQAYANCTFTVYPSLMEGFGLPVFESVAHGRPCVCSGRGALGEAAAGGGCVALDSVDASTLATAIARLVDSPSERESLAAAAAARRVKTWDEYATQLCSWVRTLSHRP